MKTLNSNRLYFISGYECGQPFHNSLLLMDILNEEANLELLYSLQDNIDNILNLAVNEALPMFTNRDSKTGNNMIIVLRKR